MMTPETLETTARACLAMHDNREGYRPLDAALRSAPLEDAYRVQDALHRLMRAGGRAAPAGWKISLTSKAMQQMTGIDQPAAGAIFSSLVHASPTRVDVGAHHQSVGNISLGRRVELVRAHHHRAGELIRLLEVNGRLPCRGCRWRWADIGRSICSSSRGRGGRGRRGMSQRGYVLSRPSRRTILSADVVRLVRRESRPSGRRRRRRGLPWVVRSAAGTGHGEAHSVGGDGREPASRVVHQRDRRDVSAPMPVALAATG